MGRLNSTQTKCLCHGMFPFRKSRRRGEIGKEGDLDFNLASREHFNCSRFPLPASGL